MGVSTNQPWAILLCKFKNVASEPPAIPPALPFRTACERFFTDPAAGFNAVRFFADMSHGAVDLSGSQVLGWYTIEANLTGFNAQGDPLLDKTEFEIVELAKDAARDAGVALETFVGVVVIMNLATGYAQGNTLPGSEPIGWMATDWRRIDGRNFDGTLGARARGGGNGTETMGQEMGHGFGLGHSRQDGSNVDYQDFWDIMSTIGSAHSAADNDYAARGPGMNAWNMRGRGWLDESRVWHCPIGNFSETIVLRPLHRLDLTGFLAAELPPTNNTNGFPKYLIEYRKRADWDAAIPHSCVLIHRYEGGPIGDLNVLLNHSYIMSGTAGQFDLAEGDRFEDNAGPFSRLRVISIDDATDTAVVQVCHSRVAWAKPSVSVVRKVGWSRCNPKALVEGNTYTFGFKLSDASCMPDYRVQWSVTGALPLSGQSSDSSEFSLVAPAAGVAVHVTITIVFDDGTSIGAQLDISSISQHEGSLNEVICRALDDARMKPIPWWEWDPEKLRQVLARFAPEQRALIQKHITLGARNISAAVDALQKKESH